MDTSKAKVSSELTESVGVYHTVGEQQHIPFHGTGAIVIDAEVAIARWLRARRCLAIDQLCRMKQSCYRSGLRVLHSGLIATATFSQSRQIAKSK